VVEFEPEERAVVESYLRASPGPNRAWMAGLVLGGIVCLAALIMLAAAPTAKLSFVLLSLVAGLVVMARALDGRNKTILARIIQKYDRASGGGH